ncbi:hypothetical protein ACPPVT_02705 [Angustibacter sp. McL0619]|uniref:hypothetical protein n=1 Tax=Angustibacter sp. McL0619 TaxID=3415676 RepID=UPI003CEDA3F1
MSRIEPSSRYARIGTAAVVALAVVNVVLIALAMNQSAQRDQPIGPAANFAQVTPSPSPFDTPLDATTTSSPASTPTTTTTATAATSVPAVPLRVMVSAVGPDVAWRVTSPACSSLGVVSAQSSADGGRSWRPSPLPVGVVVRLQATSVDRAFVIAADGTSPPCAARYRSTANGDAWSSGRDPSRAWYRSPADLHRIAVPGGASGQPCGSTRDVVDLLPAGNVRAAALCSDGTVVQTADAAATWAAVAKVPGAVAIADNPSGSGYVAAVRGVGECAGVSVVTVRHAPRPLGCIAELPNDTGAGMVAVSSAEQTVWVVAGPAVYVSTDAGRTFTRRAG